MLRLNSGFFLPLHPRLYPTKFLHGGCEARSDFEEGMTGQPWAKLGLHVDAITLNIYRIGTYDLTRSI